MTIFNWATAASGDWNNPANWSSGAVPNAGTADVSIDALDNTGALHRNDRFR